MTGTPKLRIYLAGPEVFLPDPHEAGRAKVELCARYGFVGLFPLDAELDLSGLSKHVQAARISAANEGLMRQADAVIANLSPFRGVSMDSGTAFEVGFMRALQRPVLGYTNARADFAERARLFRGRGAAPEDCDRPDIQIEDFDLAENLMITEAITASGATIVRNSAPMEDLSAFEVCLTQARKIFGIG